MLNINNPCEPEIKMLQTKPGSDDEYLMRVLTLEHLLDCFGGRRTLPLPAPPRC